VVVLAASVLFTVFQKKITGFLSRLKKAAAPEPEQEER
jgi:menaquinone-dependent protoporphyrinogen IX oxidase